MRILGFSFGSKENAMVQGIENHLSVVRQTIDEFAKLVDSAARGDQAGTAAHFQGVLDGESKASKVHRTLSTQIAQGAFFGGVREDVLNLLVKLDDVATSSKDAARLIGQEGQLDDFSRSILGSENMQKFVANQIGTVSALADLLNAFKLGRKEVMARLPKVEESEEAADVNKADLLRQIFAGAEKPNPVSLIQMRDFVMRSDDISDNAEDASDVVLVLIAKGYD